jgi:hypothetical protein
VAAPQRAGSPTTRPAAATTRPAAAQPSWRDAILERLKRLPASELAEPVALADELFGSGHVLEAASLYEHALARGPAADEKAWVLCQLANCRRAADPNAAEALYLRVVREHSSSAWASVAAVEQKLLAWRRTNRPLALVKQTEAIGRSRAPAAPAPTTRPAGAAAPARRGPTTQRARGKAAARAASVTTGGGHG